MQNFENKIYMMFASNKKEAALLMKQIYLQGVAYENDLKALSYLGLPVHSCINMEKTTWVGSECLEEKFIKFCDLPRFSRLKENFENELKYEKAKKELKEELFIAFKIKNLFNIFIKILKKVYIIKI